MRSLRALWLLAALVACSLQLVFACDKGQQSTDQRTTGQPPPTEDRTVLLSVVMTNSGFIRDARAISGPPTLQQAALKLVSRKKYKGQAIDRWGTTPVGHSATQLMLAITFPEQKGIPPKIQQAMYAGVSSCTVAANRVRVSTEVMELFYLWDRVQPVYPAEAENIKDPLTLRVVVGKEGNVLKVEKISGPDLLVPGAVEAVTKWKYRPYLINGEPVEVETTVDLSAASVTRPPLSWLFNTRPVIPVLVASGTKK